MEDKEKVRTWYPESYAKDGMHGWKILNPLEGPSHDDEIGEGADEEEAWEDAADFVSGLGEQRKEKHFQEAGEHARQIEQQGARVARDAEARRYDEMMTHMVELDATFLLLKQTTSLVAAFHEDK